METMSSGRPLAVLPAGTPVRRGTALDAAAAGEFLASLLGLSEPLSRYAMWKYARCGAIPHKRLGRHVWFRTDELEAFAQRDGSATLAGRIAGAGAGE